MRSQIILDASPLVAFLDNRDDFHRWSDRIFKTTDRPFLTCEAVVTEACFLLSRTPGAQEAVMSMIEEGTICINFSLNENAEVLSRLISQYNSVPMSLADACLVRMAELNPDSVVMTFDSDFNIYRKHRNRVISLITPRE